MLDLRTSFYQKENITLTKKHDLNKLYEEEEEEQNRLF